MNPLYCDSIFKKMNFRKMIGTIYYLIPDIFKKKFSSREFIRRLRRGEAFRYVRDCFVLKKRAIGGIKIFYQHCKILRELGFNAYPLALGGYDGNLYYEDIKSKKLAEIGTNLRSNDIVVVTEHSPYDGLMFNNCKKIMFAQSWIYLSARFKEKDKEKSYRELGYDYVISCGAYITQTIKTLHNEDCITISNGVDTDIFYPDEKVRINNRVMCLPRKNNADIQLIKKIVLKRLPGIEFVEVDGVSESEIAFEYRKSDIFLATGYPEGFGLPPLEAMFSGCIVVGFAGRGGRQYLIDDETALISEDGDCTDAACNLLSLLTNPELKSKLRANTEKITKDFTSQAMKSRIKDFYLELNNDI